MTLHLAEISLAVAPGAHAVVPMDQAGWHITGKLVVPANINIVPLPAECPELNPVENVWQFMRDNWLSNRIFTSHDNIVEHCCEAWNKLVDRPWRIITVGSTSSIGELGIKLCDPLVEGGPAQAHVAHEPVDARAEHRLVAIQHLTPG